MISFTKKTAYLSIVALAAVAIFKPDGDLSSRMLTVEEEVRKMTISQDSRPVLTIPSSFFSEY